MADKEIIQVTPGGKDDAVVMPSGFRGEDERAVLEAVNRALLEHWPHLDELEQSAYRRFGRVDHLCVLWVHPSCPLHRVALAQVPDAMRVPLRRAGADDGFLVALPRRVVPNLLPRYAPLCAFLARVRPRPSEYVFCVLHEQEAVYRLVRVEPNRIIRARDAW